MSRYDPLEGPGEPMAPRFPDVEAARERAEHRARVAQLRARLRRTQRELELVLASPPPPRPRRERPPRQRITDAGQLVDLDQLGDA